MMYPQQGNVRDRITQALMEVQNPAPRTPMPDVGSLGQGMNMPAVTTPGTMASMNAQSPASPSYGGVQAMQGQPQMFQQPPMMGAGASPPSMPTPGAPQPMPPQAPGAAPPMRY